MRLKIGTQMVSNYNIVKIYINHSRCINEINQIEKLKYSRVMYESMIHFLLNTELKQKYGRIK